MEKWPTNELPPDSTEGREGELKTNEAGKKYEYEKDGHYYGGDYLPEPPSEVNIDTDLLK